MDLARAPRRARLTARKKGSGYENGLACPVRCRITGGHCAREVCEVRGIKMLTLEMTTCVRSILDIFYNFQTKIRIFGTKSIRLV